MSVNISIDATAFIANHDERATRACTIVHIVPVRCILAFYYRTEGIEREREREEARDVYTQIYKYISNLLQTKSEISN